MNAASRSPCVPEAIVIGASAGGVQALQVLLSSLPSRFHPPILIVQHIPRDRPSGIAEMLDGHCVLPVGEAWDKQPIVAGSVMFAPPDYHLLVENRSAVALCMDDAVLYSRPSINVLFESAAAVFGPGLLAILLTGASTDGSDGVAAVRRAAGVVWIQCPNEAVASLMPSAALAHGGADDVLTLAEMCIRLKGFGL